jgi:hypothetical protein
MDSKGEIPILWRSLARDYRSAYGKKVDPETIANDIADMRRDVEGPWVEAHTAC